MVSSGVQRQTPPPNFQGLRMSRISRNEQHMWNAYIASLRSTCNRSQVGAAIVKEGRVISTGYNGAPSGLPHCGPECSLDNPCTRTVHAEAGAISYAARVGIATEGATLYCTHEPCIDCAKLIINSGIIHVYYETPYRKKEGSELLRSAGVTVSRWTRQPLPTVQPVRDNEDSLQLGLWWRKGNGGSGGPNGSGGLGR